MLTPALADHVLRVLGIPLLSLLTQEELAGVGPPAAVEFVATPVLRGRLGAGSPFPQPGPEAGHYFLPRRLWAAAVNPAVVQIDSRETALSPLVEASDWVLLDRSPRLRRKPRFEYAYALSWKGRGYVVRCRVVSGALVLVADNPDPSADIPSQIPLASHDVLDIVQGRIVWVARDL
jgi:hypothetical protein